jgi:hypothetical protein
MTPDQQALREAFRATATRHYRTMTDHGGPTEAFLDALIADAAAHSGTAGEPAAAAPRPARARSPRKPA